MCNVAAVRVESVKRGEYVRRKPSALAVFIRGEYCRETKRYSLIDTEDASREVFVKRGTLLCVGFTY